MKTILNNILDQKTLSAEEARKLVFDIVEEQYSPAQVSAFLSAYLMRPITVEEISGFRDAMLQLSSEVEFGFDTLDIVGTGGDGKNTFNISTLSCFVAAGAGIKVTKHGNYGVSSITGSSNLLEAIGYKFTKDKGILEKQLDDAGLCFLHAPLFHPAMSSIAPIRKELGVRTFFNLLGPLVNPCRPKYQLLGVYNLELARLYNYLLQESEVNYAIVHSFDGYDEISLTSEFKLITRTTEQLIFPSFIGFDTFQDRDLFGGDSVKDASELFLSILKGDGSHAQNSVVIANSGIAIHCARPELSLDDCISMARESLVSKRAYNGYKILTKN